MQLEHEKPFVPYPSPFWRTVLRLPLNLYALGLGNLVGLMPFLVLTTKGQRSGLPRHAVLEYRRHGSKFYVLSVWGSRPSWYQNLLANPIVTLQLGGRQIAARATPVTDVQEIARAVYRFRKNSPFYAELLARISSAEEINLGTLVDISGEFTVVRFDPLQAEPALKGIEASRWWVTSVAIMMMALASIGWLWKRRHH